MIEGCSGPNSSKVNAAYSWSAHGRTASSFDFLLQCPLRELRTQHVSPRTPSSCIRCQVRPPKTGIPLVRRRERRSPSRDQRGPISKRKNPGLISALCDLELMVSAEAHDKLGALIPTTEAVSCTFISLFETLNIIFPGIPDYPPPSFQEAINAGLSPSPSTISLAPATISAISDDLPEQQPAQEPTTNRARKEIDPIKEEEESDNDECVIVNKNEIPISSTDLPPPKRDERGKMDWLKRRKPEPPGVSTSNVVKLDEQPRGRKSSRPSLRINPDFDSTDPGPVELPLNSPKRRFLSLSPIRTIFPLRTAGQQERSSVSANPSPISPKSPLIASRNFLRSSNSLAAASVLKLPGSSPPTAGPKKESLSRRLFSHKGKERAQDPVPVVVVVVENLEDDWEVVETADETESQPQSLMSAIESLSLNGSTATLLSKCSPTTTTKNVQHNSSKSRVVDEKASASSIGTSPSSSLGEDEARPDNRDSPMDPPQSEILESPPTSPTLVANTPTSSTPPTRSLNLPIDSQPPPVPTVLPPIPASPLPVMTQPIPFLTGDHHVADRDVVFQLALETPLPTTPVYQHRTEHSNPTAVKEGLLPPLVPVAVWRSPGAARSTPDFFQERYRTPSPGPVSNCSCCGRTNVTTPFKYIPSPLSISVFPSYPTGTPSTHRFVSAQMPAAEDPSSILMKHHHYSGRPLPRLPPNSDSPRTNLNPVSTLQDGRVSSVSLAEPQDGRSGTEGLLIDLEDTSLDANALSPTTTVTTSSDESRYQSQVYLPLASPTSSTVEFAHEASTSPMEFMDLSYASSPSSMQATSTMIAPASAGPTHLSSSSSCSHHRLHVHHQSHQTLPKSSNLDLAVRYCDGLHCELHSSSCHHHQPRLHQEDAGNVRQCWSCQPPSPLTWRGTLNPPPLPPPPNPHQALPSVPHGVYQPQHYHQQHLPMDTTTTTQRQRHHITHLSY